MSLTASRPVIGLAMGDPAGVSPELAAKLLALPEIHAAADLIVIGDLRLLRLGATQAGVAVNVDPRPSLDDLTPRGRPVFVDFGDFDPAILKLGVATKQGGAFALRNFRTCVKLASAGRLDAVTFTPFNKTAMRLAHPAYEDEIVYTAALLGLTSPASEFNILEGLWNARVTSHVPLSAVPALLTIDGIVRAIRLTHESLTEAGFNPARIAVAAPQSACRRQRQFRARGDRHHRAGGGAGEGRRHRVRRAVSVRHRVLARARRQLRCRGDDVSRPGTDRDQADRLRSRRDAAGRLPVSDLHARRTAPRTTSPARAAPMSVRSARQCCWRRAWHSDAQSGARARPPDDLTNEPKKSMEEP